MTLRIERSLAQDRAVIRLIGRMQRECLADLEAEIESTKPKPTLDLREVTLVDVEAVSPHHVPGQWRRPAALFPIHPPVDDQGACATGVTHEDNNETRDKMTSRLRRAMTT